MPRISSGKRYAQAAFELALERKEFESWHEGLKKIAELTADDKLMALLESPRIPFDTKKELLQKWLGEVNALALNLALLLANKGRLRIVGDIFRAYQDLLDAHRGIERARVIAAIPLDEKDRDAISNRLGEIVKRQVVLDAQTDSAIVGGFIARIRDTLIDGSIRQRLENLKKSMVETVR